MTVIRRLLLSTSAVLLVLPVDAALRAEDGDPVEKLIDVIVDENDTLAETQERIDAVSDNADDLLAEWRAVQRRNKSLRAYNKQIQVLVDAQQKELDEIRNQIDRVSEISRQMTPLILRMVDGLESFIKLDVPFLLDERKKRIEGLRSILDRSDIAESEKFRRVLEAYQIETEYGRTIESYREEVEASDGKLNTVEVLRIGRLALLSTSLDGQEGHYYDRVSKTWLPVSPEQLRTIRKGLRMANKQAAPDLLRVPVPAPRQGERINVPEAMRR